MPDGAQWMTVRQFADAAGVSPQAIYQRLDKSLSSYLKAENGRKYINSDALQLLRLSSTCQADSSTCQAVDKQPEPAEAAALDAMRDLIDRQAAELEQIRAQLDVAQEDLTAARQAAAVAAAERDAEHQRAEDLKEALQTSQQTQNQLAAALTAAQALHAGTIRGQLETTAGEPEQAAPSKENEPDPDPMPEKKHRSLIAKLFRR